MKSPQGLFWSTPARRKSFARDGDLTEAELEQIVQELEAAQTRPATTWDRGRGRGGLRLVTSGDCVEP